jgi:hypothetical protein
MEPGGTPPSRRLARRRPAAAESETLSSQPARTPAFRSLFSEYRSLG